jgi:2-methylaconitate cis-trans-isomerase PrpF
MGRRLRSTFIRGGTSKALVFHARDLPSGRAECESLFLAAMGSPDPYGRQLDGMGGGLSSLSKACIVGPPSVPGADVDYTFVQVQVKEARCDWRGNCGNMSSAIGPFAVDEGLVPRPADGMATVRIHNTNTGKIIRATFEVKDGAGVERGTLRIPGVAGAGAPVRLDFLDPGGATTSRLLPTGRPVDTLDVPGLGRIEASMVDAANACVFVDAASLGLSGIELPDTLAVDASALRRLADVRLAASVAMGIAADIDAARESPLVPLIGFVAAPRDSRTLDGETLAADDCDLVVRMISNGQPHRALPLTGSLCTAVAMQIEGSVPYRLARRRNGPQALAMPSGVLTVDAAVRVRNGQWHVEHGSLYRTTRRLFEGYVHV